MSKICTDRYELYLNGVVAVRRKSAQFAPAPQNVCTGRIVFRAFNHALAAAATNATVEALIPAIDTRLHRAVWAAAAVDASGAPMVVKTWVEPQGPSSSSTVAGDGDIDGGCVREGCVCWFCCEHQKKVELS